MAQLDYLVLALQRQWELQKCKSCAPFYVLSNFRAVLLHRLVADIVDSRLKTAKEMGADVTINCSKENLKERGS